MLKNILQLLFELAYSFVDIDFLGLAKNADFHFHISKEFTDHEGIFM